MIRGEGWESDQFTHVLGYRRPIVREPDLGLGWSERSQVVAPDPASEAEVAVARVVAGLPGDGMRWIEHLDPIRCLVVPIWMVGVVHGHAEDLARCRQGLAVEGIADPARAVYCSVFRGVGEDRENGVGRGLDGDTRA